MDPKVTQMNPSPVAPDRAQIFSLFPLLPPELRAHIWVLCLQQTPRIVKWTRKVNRNVFESTGKRSTSVVFELCREARRVAMVYGGYLDLGSGLQSNDESLDSSEGEGISRVDSQDQGQYQELVTKGRHVWFSPVVDYLIFDPLWTDLIPRITHAHAQNFQARADPLDSLALFPGLALQDVRNIMVHPNYTDERKKPLARLERFAALERILVAADEKSVGAQSKFMMGTVHDLRMYFRADVGRRLLGFKSPYIAVGCLGRERARARTMGLGLGRGEGEGEGDGDRRELVAVFDSVEEMKRQLENLRGEEWRFTQEMKNERGASKLKMKLNFCKRDGREVSVLPGYGDGDRKSGEKKEKEKGAEKKMENDQQNEEDGKTDELPSYEEAAGDLAARVASLSLS
ncbi:hypothetical protein PZA11_002891 [Diplocarpon coronariae]|uniref:2EXR domain-containing protein n=1 Tax=Diplocarpon coronariae TaxID=2795749 RepID=A0A218Z3R4_9HELO|nr:hypothetical protein B2J93_4735 [Marssonina coronariae]